MAKMRFNFDMEMRQGKRRLLGLGNVSDPERKNPLANQGVNLLGQFKHLGCLLKGV